MRRISLIGLLLSALQVGCLDVPVEPAVPTPGDGRGEISGEYSVGFQGTTAFGTDLVGEGAFELVLVAGDGEFEMRVQMGAGGRPPPGLYTIRAPTSGLHAEVQFTPPGRTEMQSFDSEFGRLSIVTSTEQTLYGTLSFRAENRVTGRNIRVVAGFNALCSPTETTSCQ